MDRRQFLAMIAAAPMLRIVQPPKEIWIDFNYTPSDETARAITDLFIRTARFTHQPVARVFNLPPDKFTS